VGDGVALLVERLKGEDTSVRVQREDEVKVGRLASQGSGKRTSGHRNGREHLIVRGVGVRDGRVLGRRDTGHLDTRARVTGTVQRFNVAPARSLIRMTPARTMVCLGTIGGARVNAVRHRIAIRVHVGDATATHTSVRLGRVPRALIKAIQKAIGITVSNLTIRTRMSRSSTTAKN
jgi:hypothetical protein